MDLSQFMTDIGIDQLPPEKQQENIESILRTLSMRMSLRLGEEMSPEQMQALEEAYEKGTAEARAEIDRQYPNYDAIMQEEMESLKEDILSL